MEVYEQCLEYRFGVCGEQMAVSPVVTLDGIKSVFVEETRKNGQEDCHMSGVLVLRDGSWSWDDEDGSESFDAYHSPALSKAIVDFLNDNPHPDLARSGEFAND